MTMAPLPAWANLFSALANSSDQDETLAAPWCRSGDVPFWFSRSAWSLAAVVRWRQQLRKQSVVTVWIPDFFCNSALGLLREMDTQLVFYPITDKMVPDLEACKSLAGEFTPDVVVLVHYFGQPVPAESIATFCKEQGAWLIEDAVHVLQPVAGVGEWGDCVLYSPHKLLPIPDGAVLIVRSSGPGYFSEQDQAVNVLREIYTNYLESSGTSPKQAISWLIKRILQLLGVRSHRFVETFLDGGNQTNLEVGCPGMSVLAKRLLSRLRYHLDAVALLRSQRFKDLCEMLSWANPITTLSPQLSESTPYLAGFVCRQEIDAEVFFEKSQRAGLHFTTWPDLPPEVIGCEEAHSTAMLLRHNRLYLPVHQTIDKKQILKGGKSLLNSVIKKWQVRDLTQEEWETYWQLCSKVNLLQSWEYGDSKTEAEGWQAHRFLISDGSQPVALAQVLTKRLPFVGGVARMNRGPILLNNIFEEMELPTGLAALGVLLRELHRRRLWMIQVAPEMPNTNEAKLGMQALGFKQLPLLTWSSALLALNVEEDALLMGLKGKWRNCLRKGEKLGVVVSHHECKGRELDLLVYKYKELQKHREFIGLSETLIRALAKKGEEKWQFNLFIARETGVQTEDDPLGLLATIRTGDTAIYLIASTNEKGRRMQANSVLLWQAILYAKHSGCSWFDVGGVNQATTKGVAGFKKGLNAKPYELVGEWRKWNGFFKIG